MPENPLLPMIKIDPEFMERLEKTRELVYADGALPRKIKLLIAMAFDAAHGAERGVASLAKRAMAEGATRNEIAEALRVAYHLTGVGCMYTASQGLAEILG